MDKEQAMIKTIFDEKYEQGIAEGEARGIETLLHILPNVLVMFRPASMTSSRHL